MSQTGGRYRRAGSCLIALGMISILAAAALVLFNICDGERARKASTDILTQLDPLIRAEAQGNGGAGESEAAKDLAGRMPTVLIGGYAYIGEIEIPSLQIRLPVMESWDYDRLKISPCRYSGSCEQKHSFCARSVPTISTSSELTIYGRGESLPKI